MLKMILLILAIVCFVLDAFHVNLSGIGLFSLGWAFVISSLLV
jgi:hypothetical protein